MLGGDNFLGWWYDQKHPDPCCNNQVRQFRMVCNAGLQTGNVLLTRQLMWMVAKLFLVTSVCAVSLFDAVKHVAGDSCALGPAANEEVVDGNQGPTDMRIAGLEKQLRIEMMVKQGAENMMKSYTSGHKVRLYYVFHLSLRPIADHKAKDQWTPY